VVKVSKLPVQAQSAEVYPNLQVTDSRTVALVRIPPHRQKIRLYQRVTEWRPLTTSRPPIRICHVLLPPGFEDHTPNSPPN
jgi:hypothetical protein